MDIEYQFWSKEEERNREVSELRASRRAQRIVSTEPRAARSSSNRGAPDAGLARQSRLIPRRLE